MGGLMGGRRDLRGKKERSLKEMRGRPQAKGTM